VSYALLVPRTHLDRFRAALHKLAGYDWDRDGNINVCDTGTGAPDPERVIPFCQVHGVTEVLVPANLYLDDRPFKRAGYDVTFGKSLDYLLNGPGLQRFLTERGLDWRSHARSLLSEYGLAVVSDDDVEHWLAQFERLSEHRPVGEHLLQLLDIVPAAAFGEALTTEASYYGGQELVVGFNRERNYGKSWAAVAFQLAKRFKNLPLLPIDEAIVAGAAPKVLRLLEDGLFSGTETRGIFDSLLGLRAPGREPKVKPLGDPFTLKRVAAQIQYAAVCDFGEAIVRRYLKAQSLLNVQVGLATAIRKFRVLSEESDPPLAAVTAELLRDDLYIAWLRSRVQPFAFQGDKGWRDEALRERALVFCTQIGEQLWQNYIVRKRFDLTRWPPARIRRCALGMEGLGLTFAFPHSVPKATLPVFWSRGTVTLDGVSLEWAPLLPNADT